MESFGRIVEILVTIVLLFLIPLNYMAIKQEQITQTYITTETSYLVDSVRNLGYLTDQMYTVFLKKINASNQVYQVELIHYKRMVEMVPIALEGTENEYNYYCTYTDDILAKLYPEGMDDNTNTEYSQMYHTYEFNQGDYFTMKVTNKNKTYATRLSELFLQRGLPKEQIMVVYGGAIRDEAY